MKPFNPYKKFVCIQIPLWLLVRGEVSGQAKIVYGFLMRHAGEDGNCFPGQATLAAEIGIKGGGNTPLENACRALRRYTDELVANQLIQVNQPGLHKTNRYEFLPHPWMSSYEVADAKISGQDKTKSSGQERTGLSSRRQKQGNRATLSSASPQEILDSIVMENEGDQQAREQLIDEYGDDNFFVAATAVFKRGRILYLSTIRKELRRSQSKKPGAKFAEEHNEKCIRTSASSTSGNQNIAKRFLQNRHAN